MNKSIDPIRYREVRAFIERFGPCDEAVAWLDENQVPNMQAAWDRCPRGDWLAWTIDQLNLGEPGLIQGLLLEVIKRLIRGLPLKDRAHFTPLVDAAYRYCAAKDGMARRARRGGVYDALAGISVGYAYEHRTDPALLQIRQAALRLIEPGCQRSCRGQLARTLEEIARFDALAPVNAWFARWVRTVLRNPFVARGRSR